MKAADKEYLPNDLGKKEDSKSNTIYIQDERQALET